MRRCLIIRWRDQPGPACRGRRRDATSRRRNALPRLNSSLTLTRFQEPMVVAPLHGFDPTSPPQFDRGLVQIGLGLENTLFDGGGRRARLGAAEAAAGASRAGLAAAELEVIQTVVAAYVGVLTAREVDHAARQREVDLGAERGRSMRFLAEGAAARVEVLRAEAALQHAKAAAATATARAGLALRNLARATGIEISALMRRPLEEVSGPTGADEFPGSPSELLGPDRTPAIERAGRAAGGGTIRRRGIARPPGAPHRGHRRASRLREHLRRLCR